MKQVDLVILNERSFKLNDGIENDGPVIYWMSRDQRLQDNWALIYSLIHAEKKRTYVIVVFCLLDEFLGANKNHYAFMIQGLIELAHNCEKYSIPFELVVGNPIYEIPKLIFNHNASLLVTDFDPLKIKRNWKSQIAKKISIPFFEVDAHNIVPVWKVSDKEEFAAYTIRPKIHKLLNRYLIEFPKLTKQNNVNFPVVNNIHPQIVEQYIKYFNYYSDFKAGESEASSRFYRWVNEKFIDYADYRNDPVRRCQSDLSPYLHFGMISAQRIALEVNKLLFNHLPDEKLTSSANAFLEELIIRRELSDNFCYYNKNYDNFDGFQQWAKDTLNKHRNDKREYIYTLEEFESANTHDDLWNAAQIEMIQRGKMHGYMRMYWAKKILEWTKSPDEAIEIAIYLNDKYELDGRDPNGYTGIAWSIGGVHDRPWSERPVFGKIRFMNYNGCKRKFDVDKYIQMNIEKGIN